jgi:sulfhydrogenase subunit gamma (sulfur reductase)
VNNPYEPFPAQIEDIIIENDAKDIKTFKLHLTNKKDREDFRYMPGQFAELSILGAGECPIGIASSPTERGYLLFTVKRAGIVTTRLHHTEVGEIIGLRGPLGNTYPMDIMEKKNVLIVGGGFAFTTLRSTINYITDSSNRERFDDIIVIYGARSPGELLYKGELWQWEKQDNLEIFVTVDKGDKNWTRREGFVPTVLKEVAPSSNNTIALVCGPPIMIKFTLPVLKDLGFTSESIFLSLEMRMKCGIGKCGRCNIGHKYVCKDGPVFSYAELQGLPDEY